MARWIQGLNQDPHFFPGGKLIAGELCSAAQCRYNLLLRMLLTGMSDAAGVGRTGVMFVGSWALTGGSSLWSDAVGPPPLRARDCTYLWSTATGHLTVVTGHGAFRMTNWAVEPSSNLRVRETFSIPTNMCSIPLSLANRTISSPGERPLAN